MSKIIKAFEITGEYRLDDVEIEENGNNSYSDYRENYLQKGKGEYSDNIGGNINEQLERARDQAEEIISAATDRAAKIVEDAEKEARSISEKAYKEGYEQGLNEGRKQGYQEGLAQMQQNLVNMNDKLEQARKDLKRQKEEIPQTVINLAVQIAGRIVNAGLNINPEIINNIIIDILQDVGNDYDNIVIKINPDLLQHVNEFETGSHCSGTNLEFEGDSSLKYGDCIVETEFGGKDGTIKNKLDLLEQKLYKEADFNES